MRTNSRRFAQCAKALPTCFLLTLNGNIYYKNIVDEILRSEYTVT